MTVFKLIINVISGTAWFLSGHKCPLWCSRRQLSFSIRYVLP